MARIYLDTNLWNISCDQEIKPEVLLKRLDEEGSTLVIGLNAVDELSKTFLKVESYERAKKLFSHLEAYLNSGLRCIAKEINESLVAEMWALRGAENSGKFLGSQDVFKVNNLVSQFARGELPAGCLDQLMVRQSLARSERERTVAHLSDQPALKEELFRIDESMFGCWLGEQLKSQKAIHLLTEKLGLRFPAIATIELLEYAKALINSNSRLAVALLSADFYYSWRCAHNGSNPKDLLDDLHHVLNASYCDVYVTEENKQLRYTGVILSSTRTAIYNRKTGPLDQWLISIAKRERH